MSRRRVGPALALAASMLALTGCEKAMRDMYDQPRHKPLAESELFDDGRSARTPPQGSLPVKRGAIAAASGGRTGADYAPHAPTPTVRPQLGGIFGGAAAPPTVRPPQGMPRPVTRETYARGRSRFEIFCAPCHGVLGDGNGPVAERGFPHPPTFHQPRLRNAPAQHFFDVMTAGYGLMYPYADRVAPADRWAIVAYIRALQLSQYAPTRLVPAEQRAHLEDGGRDGRR
ncbi:MAG TPA: cytochrome c [Pelomicrobium sp.]|nr:cytochrome c [Pelomicrobium sp.]